MTDCYRTIKGSFQAKIARKKSRFTSICHHVSSTEEVTSLLESSRRDYHDASHRCYAYRLNSEGSPIEYSSDAGEPGGSAGMPILQQIQKNNLLDVLVIVVRYFGGTKLGIRGLIEAYGDAAAEVLRVAEKIFVRHVVRLWVCFPPEISSQVFGLIHRHKAQLKETDYNREGHVLVAIPASSVSSFTEQLTEATGGRARWEERND